MLNRQKLLKLSTIVALVGAGVAIGFAAQPHQAVSTKDINALMVERRDVLAKLLDAVKARHESGLISIEAVCKAQNELVAAELELAKTHEERLKALNARLTNAQLLENRALELKKMGMKGGEADVAFAATASRLLAEIQLLRELETAK